MENKEGFSFTYSAKEQEEIKAIRKKYLTEDKTEDEMTRLRRLDKTVTGKATVFSLVLGIIGTLVMGSGMSLAMTDIGALLGMETGLAMLVGIAVGVCGLVLASLAYPCYNRVLTKEREKIAPEIIRLSDSLLK